MKRIGFFVLIALMIASSVSFQIKNINHDVNPQTSEQYIQYIKTLSGLSTQQDLLSNQQLAKLVKNQRLSIVNSVQDIVLVLIDQIKENPQIIASIQDIESLKNIDSQLENFEILNMADFNIQTIKQKIEELQKLGKIVNTLEISQELSKQFSTNQRRLQQVDSEESEESVSSESTLLQQSEKTIHNQQKMVSQVPPAKSSSYVLKFFFCILFIIVSLGSLASIANMENRKDTLLYAKFIADIGR